jgi:cytochrome c oxidase assembly protein subunit 15
VSTPSPLPPRPAVRRLALAALVANIGIVFTGGLVRVTGSGLGCPEWPTCDGTRVAPGAVDTGWHQYVEFGNRLLTFVVLAAAVGAWWAVRRHARDRPDLRVPALILPLGVLAQALLGGITVLLDLHPLIVAGHFLLSMVLVAAATVLWARARGTVADPAASARTRRLVGALAVAGAVVLVLGTLVTAAGPHAGDPDTPRLALDIRTIARVHSASVWLTVALTGAVLVRARRERADLLARAATLLLAAEVVQGAVGYTQYLTGIPAPLVSAHILLATLFWVAVCWVTLRGLPLPARTDVDRRDAVAV